MASTRLTDEQADGVMRRMCGFIEQEALEKAKEIKIKADQDYNVEKARIVRREIAALQEQGKKREKDADVKRKIFITHCSNENKIAVLRKQDELLNVLAENARTKIQTISSDETKYKSLVENLVLQSVYSLLEPEISLQCLQRDAQALEAILPSAKQRAFETTGISCNFSIDSVNWLPAYELGGIVASCNGGRIKVLNSLLSRLEVSRQQLLPEIRVLLYGQPPNRKFFD